MAAITTPSDQAEQLLQKLSLDSQQPPDPAKKASSVQYAPVNTGIQANAPNNQFDGSAPPFGSNYSDSSMWQNPNAFSSSAYYYGGAFNGSSGNDWERCSAPNGVEVTPGVYGDYQNSYGCTPYSPYSSSGSPMGYDNQLYATLQYQYPTSYYQPSGVNNGDYTTNRTNTFQTDVSTSIAADQAQLPRGTAKENQGAVGNAFNNRSNVSKPARSNHQKPSIKSNDFYGWGGFASASSVNSSAFSYGNNFASGRNQNLQSLPHLMGLQYPQGMEQAGFASRMYPSSRMYGQYTATYRSGPGYASRKYDNRVNGHGWLMVDNKSSGRGSSLLVYGNGNADGLNELNKGPRSKGFKDSKDSEPITLAVKGQSLPLKGKSEEHNLSLIPDRDQYNKDDFPELHSDARFFIIKSYSEDDVHKSIKYGIWTSTLNGNKKLDAAYKEAQEKLGACPVFLLFSVNASGQFVGLAEMTGPVDFEQTAEYWQQDKWTGCFPVKWHTIKDVANSMLRHITLQNNDNKPVTNSRDTQEVNFEQGCEIIKIFTGHSSRTCILDDFEFYEGRQRTMQERKAKQKELNKQARVDDTEKSGSNSKRGVVESNGELKNGLAMKTEDTIGSSFPNNKAMSK